MGQSFNSYVHPYTFTHKDLILQQVERCNAIFSSYNPAPVVADPKLRTYDYTAAAQTGKVIALAVLALESLARPVLYPAFFTDKEITAKRFKAFGKVERKDGFTYRDNLDKLIQFEGYLYLAPDTTLQFEGIYHIVEYYDKLIGAIFGLPDFSNVRTIKAEQIVAAMREAGKLGEPININEELPEDYDEDIDEEDKLFGEK